MGRWRDGEKKEGEKCNSSTPHLPISPSPISSTTIFAEATARGKAGVAIIRISGTMSGDALLHLGLRNLPKPRRARLAKIYDSAGEIIDEALILWMPGPHSFTGEDVAEIHVHGSRAVVDILSKTLLSFGMHIAQPGEFTRRALLNGRMDLTEVEGLADLLAAETKYQQRQALRQMQGELGKLYESWRSSIISALAHIEAYIDFPDEDLPASLIENFQREIKRLADSIEAHLNDGARGQIIRRGFHIAILGAPNVGKSSLLNYLARSDVAIVSEIPGTTRDVIEVSLDIAGFPVIIADTAGIRETEDAIEIEGVKRARARGLEADMKIVMLDAGEYPDFDKESLALIDEDTLVVVNKCDLNPWIVDRGSWIENKNAEPRITNHESRYLHISLKNKTGLTDLLQKLAKFLETHLTPTNEPVITRERHRILLSNAIIHLKTLNNPGIFHNIELAAENLRSAAHSLGQITGHIGLEEVLDELFRSFCIGK